jgi:Ca-activated chloride channel family protein
MHKLLLAALIAAPLAAGGRLPRVTQGSLITLDREGQARAFCPLRHTEVKADITGFVARVTVTQHFENPSTEKIEAVYTFPLPHGAAVDDMTLLVGDRVVRGKIERREAAQAIYEAARDSGRLVALLDQERPNIFTQSVANIQPGEKVKVTIRYLEPLVYEDGSYSFVFPMVVGPRYIPRDLADAGRIAPPVTPPRTRAGHDISIAVQIDAGLPLEAVTSPTHAVLVERAAPERAAAKLKDQATIPNKDFILRYDVAGRKIQDAVLTHRGGRGGFFTLLLAPPERVAPGEAVPKEIVFVLDTSGSMHGFPIEKAKEAMRLAIDGMNPQDTFNLITFAGDTHVLFPEPVPATPYNIQLAQKFLALRSGRGGTEMMKAIRTALAPSDSQKHVRIVCFMTDGYVGNDQEIIAEVRRYSNARVFSFGIGSSVNRYLLDGMARAGRGEVEYVSLSDDGSAAARRFHERVQNPILTDIAVEWGGLPVADVFPQRIPDLFSAKPVAVIGRYTGPGKGVIRLRGRQAGRPFAREIPVELPADEPAHESLAPLWARARIEDLSAQGQDIHRETITRLGLDYRLMTAFTSFVAVEEVTVTEGGRPKRIEVPVEMPEGVSYQGVFGEEERQFAKAEPPMAGSHRMVPAVAVPILAPRVQEQRAASAARLDRRVSALVERLRTRRAPSPEESRFVQGGRAYLMVRLADSSPAVLAELKRLGFEIRVRTKTANVVIGWLAVEKIAALAEMRGVRYVAPAALLGRDYLGPS